MTKDECNAADGRYNQDFAVGIVARRRKPKRNAKLERFHDAGISVDMVRRKIVKLALQQGFTSRSRGLLQNLGLRQPLSPKGFTYNKNPPKIQ